MSIRKNGRNDPIYGCKGCIHHRVVVMKVKAIMSPIPVLLYAQRNSKRIIVCQTTRNLIRRYYLERPFHVDHSVNQDSHFIIVTEIFKTSR